jgi:hypothetical protein
MVKYKRLKGLAHNLGHKWLSLTNFIEGSYCHDFLVGIAKLGKRKWVSIDFMTNKIQPQEFCIHPIIKAVLYHREWLFERLNALGIGMDEVDEVKMFIGFDFENAWRTGDVKVVWRVRIRLKDGKKFEVSRVDSTLLHEDEEYRRILSKFWF